MNCLVGGRQSQELPPSAMLGATLLAKLFWGAPRRGGITSLPSVEGSCRSLGCSCDFDVPSLKTDSQAHRTTTKGRTVDNDLPSRLAR